MGFRGARRPSNHTHPKKPRASPSTARTERATRRRFTAEVPGTSASPPTSGRRGTPSPRSLSTLEPGPQDQGCGGRVELAGLAASAFPTSSGFRRTPGFLGRPTLVDGVDGQGGELSELFGEGQHRLGFGPSFSIHVEGQTDHDLPDIAVCRKIGQGSQVLVASTSSQGAGGEGEAPALVGNR